MRIKQSLTKVKSLAREYWRPSVFYGALALICVGLLWFRLDSLTGGFTPSEQLALPGTRGLLENPINAPFYALAHILFYAGDDSFSWGRVAASIFGLITLTCFYWLVRHWYGSRMAVLGTLLFATSAWFLHTARLGVPDVLLFLTFALMASYFWLKTTLGRLPLVIVCLLTASLLYVPGMIWLVLCGVIWQRRTIVELSKRLPGAITSCVLIVLALLAPLGWAIFKTPILAKVLAGLPLTGWPQLTDSLERLAMIPTNLLVRGPLDPEQWLGRLPILDGFCIVMLVFGVYWYMRRRRLVDSKWIISSIIISVILIGLGGASISLLVPFLYLLVVTGISFSLGRWYTVFPRNVISHGLAIGLICLAVAASCWYGLRHYFVAWPNAPATKALFVKPDLPG